MPRSGSRIASVSRKVRSLPERTHAAFFVRMLIYGTRAGGEAPREPAAVWQLLSDGRAQAGPSSKQPGSPPSARRPRKRRRREQPKRRG